MPNSELISQIIDIPVVTKQMEVVLSGLTDIDNAIKSMKPLGDIYKNAGTSSEFKKASEDLVNGNKKVQQSQTELGAALKEYQNLLNQASQAQAKMSVSGTEASKNLQAARIAQAEMNRELKNTAVVAQAAEGSIQQMRAQLSLLTQQYDKMGQAERNSTSGQQLQVQIKGQVEALKQLEGETGRYQRNVGNYTGAISILEKALQEVKGKIDDLTKTGQTNGEQFEKYAQEQELLTQVLNKNTQGFASLTMEIRANERALATMFEQGMADTEAYKALQQQVANASREVNEFKERQKLLSSQTPILSSMTTVVKGLGGAYATGAGTAALFADGNEKVEKELNKLVAIMTVLQGLNELHELIEKKGTIATIARGVAEKIKNFVMTGSTQGLAQNTVAQEANTAVTEAGTVATKGMSVALVGLRAALIATGIGALLILLPSIAAAMDKSSDSSERFRKRMEELKGTEPDVAEALEDLGKTAEEVADNLISKLKNETEGLDKALGKIPGDAQLASKAIDGLLEKTRDLYKEMFERKVSEDQNPWLKWFGRTSDDVAKEIEANEKKIEDIRNRVDKAATVRLYERMQKNSEEGTKEIDFNEKIAVAKAKIAGKTEKQIFDIEQQYADKRIKLLENITSQMTIDDEHRRKLEEQLLDEKNKKELAALDFQANQKKKKSGGDEVKRENEDIQKELDARFEIYKLSAQQKIELDKQIAEDDKAKVNVRMLALNASLKEEQDLIQLSTDQEIAKVNSATKTQLKSDKLTQAERLQLVKTSQAEIDLLIAKGYDEQVKAAENAQKILDDIRKGQEKEFDSGMAKKLEKKPITSSLFAKASQIVSTQEQKEKDKAGDEKENKERIDRYKQYAQAGLNLAETMFNRVHELRLNQLQAEIDKNTQLRDTEIERINSSTLSEQDKAAKIAQVQAASQAREDQLNQKKRVEQQKQAKFDKEMQVLKIIGETLVQAAAAGWVTPKAIAIEIVGAAEAAALALKPIPKYETGTDNHPGGAFIWGEAGRELAILPSGEMAFSPDTATLSEGPKGTKIIPHDEVNQMLFSVMMKNTSSVLERDPGQSAIQKEIAGLRKDLNVQTQELKKAYGKQKQKTVINNRIDTSWGDYIRKKVFE